ncbi:MAG: Fe-S cluster assembly protein SufD [Bacteroidaceae bacterium]
MNIEQQYIDLFEEQYNELCKNSAEILNVPRKEAMAHFEEQGIPKKGTERYRHTKLDDVLKLNYGVNMQGLLPKFNPYEEFECDAKGLGTDLHFLVNGVYVDKQQSNTSGVYVGSLKKFADQNPEKLRPYYNRLAAAQNDSMSQFNTAFVQDGLLLFVPRNIKVEETIQLINILHSNVDMLIFRRILVIIEQGAEAKLLLCDHVTQQQHYFSSQVIEVFVGENATLDVYDLEETHNLTSRVNHVYVEQEANSNVVINGTTLHNGLTRNDIYVDMIGQGANVELSGMIIADKEQHVDNHTFVRHKVPNCTSHELFKYVLDDFAVGAFSGRVLVERNAQKSLSEQSNKNLCLNSKAHMYTQPQLEIYADDVKCSHGATVGQLDEEAMFYMMQRGIPMAEARMLLMFAFVSDVIDQIRIPSLQERLHLLTEQRFRGELNQCAGCALCQK